MYKTLKMCQPNLRYDCYSENTELLRSKFEYWYQDFKVCEMKFAMLPTARDFYIDEVDETYTNGSDVAAAWLGLKNI